MQLIPLRLKVLALVAITTFAWCARADQQPVDAKAIEQAIRAATGRNVEIEIVQQSTTEEAKGVGASGQATGDQAKLGIDGSAPTAELPGKSKANGGDIKAKGESKIDASLLGNPLIWAGLLSLVGAAVSVYLRLPIRVALIAAAAGAAFICAAMFPAAMLFLVAGCCVAGVAFFVWSSHQADQGAKAKEALRAVVAGIATAPTGAAEVVKAEVAKQASDTDKAVIKKIKKLDDLS